MRSRTLLAVAAALMALSLGLTACGGDDDDDDAPAEGEGVSLDLTIGQLVPQTGDLSPFAPAGEKAANLAIEQIESAIDEVGEDHSVTMVTEDTQTDPQAAVSGARRAVDEGASCFAGAWASGSTIPVAESVSIRNEVLQISPASTSPDITDIEDDGFLNRTAPADTFQGTLLADVLEDGLDGAEGLTVNIGARNDAYGTGLADEFTSAWEDKGGEVGETVIYDVDLPNYNSEANQIVRGNPDGWLFIDFPEPFDQVGAALVRTGDWDPERSFGTDGLAFPNLNDVVGDEVSEGLRVTAPGAEQSEASTAFNDIFEEAGGAGRGPFDAQNFDAVVLCYLAAVAAGSAEGADMAEQLADLTNEPGDQYTFEQLPDAIRALQAGEDVDYLGASGPIALDENGDPTAGVFDVFAFRGGEMEKTSEVPFGDSAEDGEGADNEE